MTPQIYRSLRACAIVAAVSGAPTGPRWMLALEGAVGIAAAAVTFLQPRITALILLFLIAAWALVGGALLVAAAIRLGRQNGQVRIVFLSRHGAGDGDRHHDGTSGHDACHPWSPPPAGSTVPLM